MTTEYDFMMDEIKNMWPNVHPRYYNKDQAIHALTLLDDLEGLVSSPSETLEQLNWDISFRNAIHADTILDSIGGVILPDEITRINTFSEGMLRAYLHSVNTTVGDMCNRQIVHNELDGDDEIGEIINLEETDDETDTDESVDSDDSILEFIVSDNASVEYDTDYVPSSSEDEQDDQCDGENAASSGCCFRHGAKRLRNTETECKTTVRRRSDGALVVTVSHDNHSSSSSSSDSNYGAAYSEHSTDSTTASEQQSDENVECEQQQQQQEQQCENQPNPETPLDFGD